MQYLDGKTTVTHIIAASLTPKKAVEFRKYRIVKPAWIVDSVNAGKLLPWHSYRVLDEGVGQKVLGFDDGQIISQVNHKQKGYRDQTDASWYTKQLKEDDDAAGRSQNTQLPTPGTSSPFEDDDTTKQLGASAQASTKTLRRQSTADPITDLDEITPSIQEQLARDLPDLDEEDGGVALDQEKRLTDEAEQLDGDGSLHVLPGNNHGVQISNQSESVSSAALAETVDGAQHTNHDPAGEDLNAESVLGQKRKLDTPDISPNKKAKLTAEEHNSILLADPRIRKSSTLNPDFLEQYYRESRLHHLSTWKADLKAQLQALTAEQTSTQKAKQKRAPGARRYILHVDFDSFFVAVSLKNHPEYVNKPACVAHGPGPNSEIASCNYPARKFGVKNGSWMKNALEICKDLKVLPYDFPAYEEASRLFYEAIMATGGIVQSVSIDEALVDVTAFCLPAGGTDGTSVREGSIWREQEKANEIALGLRNRVKEQTGCAVSVGIGTNILLAKVALRKAKPAGQHQIKPEEVLDFIGALPVEDLPGVAHSIGGKLEEIGIKYVKDIREITKEKLVNTLGPKTGEKLWNYSRGIDRTEVGEQVIRKSVSAEVNWGVRFETQEQAEEFVESLCGELNRRLVKERVKGKQVTMKVMRRAPDAPLDPPKHLGHGKCDTYNKSVQLGVATNETSIIAREVMSVFRGWGFSPGELRGLGVQMTKLEPVKVNLGDTLSSQRRLQFKTGTSVMDPALPSDNEQAPIQEPEPKSQQDYKDRPPAHDPPSSQKRLPFKHNVAQPLQADAIEDPIQDDPETPHKPKSAQFKKGPLPAGIDSPSRKPLNTLGTQFIMPTQVDPQVLAELPADIRAKLAQHIRAPPQPARAVPIKQVADRRPKAYVSSTILPNQSQLDPTIFDALPEDVREEILAHYATSPSKPKGGQSLLPQSPHKNRTLPSRSGPAPRGRGRGRPRGSMNLLSRLKAARTTSADSTLTQTNFVANNRAISHDHTTDSDAAAPPGRNANGEISAEFLDALPEDIRQEVLAQHKAEQLKAKAGIEIARRKRNAASRPKSREQQEHLPEGITLGDVGAGGKERALVLGARPARPTFTPRCLSKITDLRDQVSLWYEEFRDDGPYEEDVQALGMYLKSVVLDERDMNKAVDVLKWMEWVVGDETAGISSRTEGFRAWCKALESAKSFVRDAVRDRGLGEVVL